MTETETWTTTTAPNGTEITTFPHETWDVRFYRKPGALVSKIIAIAPGRKNVFTREKVADSDLASTAAELTGTAKRAAIPVDVMDQIAASIDAEKRKAS